MTWSKLRIPVGLLLLAFPTLANLVEHTSSVMLVTLTALGIPVLFFRKDRPALTGAQKAVMWAFAAYFGVYLFSFAANGLLGNLPDPRPKHLDHEVRLLFVLPIFLLLRYLDISPKILWSAVVLGAIAAGLYALVKFFWVLPGQRVSGSYHPIAFGDITLALGFLSVTAVGWLKKWHPIGPAIPLAAFVLALAAAVLSETRGALIAAPVLLAILYFHAGGYLKTAARVLLLGLCCGAALAAYAVPAIDLNAKFEVISKEVADYRRGERVYTPVTTRIEGWRAALDIFAAHPIIGAGPGSFKPLLHRLVAEGRRDKIAFPHSQPHSAYLAAAADCGVMGLIAVLGLFAVPLGVSVRYMRMEGELRDLGYALLLLVASFMQFGLTETIFGRNINISFFVVMTAAILAAAANRESRAEPTASSA